MDVKSGDVLIQRKAGIPISVTIVLDDGIYANYMAQRRWNQER